MTEMEKEKKNSLGLVNIILIAFIIVGMLLSAYFIFLYLNKPMPEQVEITLQQMLARVNKSASVQPYLFTLYEKDENGANKLAKAFPKGVSLYFFGADFDVQTAIESSIINYYFNYNGKQIKAINGYYFKELPANISKEIIPINDLSAYPLNTTVEQIKQFISSLPEDKKYLFNMSLMRVGSFTTFWVVYNDGENVSACLASSPILFENSSFEKQVSFFGEDIPAPSNIPLPKSSSLEINYNTIARCISWGKEVETLGG